MICRNLAIFSAGLTTKGANSRKEFTVASNIVSAHLRARSTGDFTRAELTAAAQMQEAAAYDKGTTSDKTVTPAEGETAQPVAASPPYPSPKEREVKCFKKTIKP